MLAFPPGRNRVAGNELKDRLFGNADRPPEFYRCESPLSDPFPNRDGLHVQYHGRLVDRLKSHCYLGGSSCFLNPDTLSLAPETYECILENDFKDGFSGY